MVDQSNRSVSLIDVNPKEELPFSYMIKKTITSFISITNINNGLIAYKIKTNKPDSYLVKPNEGVLTEKQSIQVGITMQPTDFNPQTGTFEDKFLIAAMVLPPNFDPRQIPVLWKSTPTIKQHHIKLKVVLRSQENQSSLDRPNINGTEANPKESNSKPTSEDKVSTDSNESSNLTQSSVLYQSTVQKNEAKINSLAKLNLLKEIKTDNAPYRKFTFGLEKGSVEHVAFLEKDLLEVKEERDRIKSELEQSNARRKDQEQLVFQLSEEKNKLENELNMLKNSTFKLQKGTDAKEATTPLEFWHVIVVAIAAMILGGFLVK